MVLIRRFPRFQNGSLRVVGTVGVKLSVPVLVFPRFIPFRNGGFPVVATVGVNLPSVLLFSRMKLRLKKLFGPLIPPIMLPVFGFGRPRFLWWRRLILIQKIASQVILRRRLIPRSWFLRARRRFCRPLFPRVWHSFRLIGVCCILLMTRMDGLRGL